MSSASDFEYNSSSHNDSSDDDSLPASRPISSRRPSRSHTPGTPVTPRKRRRLESVDAARVRNHYLESRYIDAYRELYNEHVGQAAARFEPDEAAFRYNKHVGASVWTPTEQATLFAALARLGRDNVPGIAAAVASKSIPQVQEYLLLLHDAACKTGDARVTLRDIPSALDVSAECSEQLEVAADALAWHQELFEASQEQAKFGDYWLISPAVAAQVEEAIEGRAPRATSSPPLDADKTNSTRRGGKVVTGACTSCKRLKQRCNRETPCSNCVRRKVAQCIYKQTPTKPATEEQVEEDNGKRNTKRAGILALIPEAELLNPDIMLMLSRTLFMNRSNTISSPWPHWSEYQSKLADQPSIYRTAFNDLHTLLLSVTRRLVSTAMTQATSRLRAQQRRVKKGLQPYVKRKDVLTAIDVLGLDRHGKERWRGAARRCAVQVYDGTRKDLSENRRRRRHFISWDEVERILIVPERLPQYPQSDAETSSCDPSLFKLKSRRSGTPLPIDQLTLSSTEDSSDNDNPVSGIGTSSDGEMEVADTTTPSPSQRALAPSRSASHLESPESSILTLEQFDYHASQQEEKALWTLLGTDPSTENGKAFIDADHFGNSSTGEKIITQDPSWRTWLCYHANWEEFPNPVPKAAFFRKDSKIADAANRSIDSVDTLDPEGAGVQTAIELQAHSTKNYAALRGGALGDTAVSEASSNGLHYASDSDASIPARSIEIAEEYDRAEDTSMDLDR